MSKLERILKAAREKQTVTYKGTSIRLSADFSAETLQARKEQRDIFKSEREKASNEEYSSWQGYNSGLKKR